jgi:hypothetical protein
MRFLYFINNTNEPDKTDENDDLLWKMRAMFDKYNDAHAKYYSPPGHLAVDKMMVLFKGTVIFRQYIPKKHKWFGMKIYKLCGSKGYTYNMSAYLGKDRKHVTTTGTTTNAVGTELTASIENVWRNLIMDSFF